MGRNPFLDLLAALLPAAERDALVRRHGAERPDRVLRDPDGDLVVLACREKPEWNERITLEIGERFYRLHRVEERADRGFHAHAYLLREIDDNEVFRGLLRYAPPGTLPRGGRRPPAVISPEN